MRLLDALADVFPNSTHILVIGETDSSMCGTLY